MKKKLAMVVVVFLLSILTACRNDSSQQTINEMCRDYVKNYEVVKTKDDGSVEVKMTAPDFTKSAKYAYEVDSSVPLDAKSLKKAIEEIPDNSKEYVLVAEEDNQKAIEDAFIDQVSYDLIVAAFEQVEMKTERVEEQEK